MKKIRFYFIHILKQSLDNKAFNAHTYYCNEI